MAVEKFRTFEEASLALARRRGSDEGTQLAARVSALWAMSAALAAPLECRGVRKFRSIEEADADRVRMTLERPQMPPPRVR
jgi:hypothetical protein